MPTAPAIERKQVLLEGADLKNDNSGSFSGYASVFGGVDSYGDTIVRGAYTGTIANFLTHGFIGWSHDDATPIAFPTKVFEDDHGLWIEATFHGTPEAQKARQIAQERLAAGKSMGLSIGYWPAETEPGPEGTRRLLAIELVETSLVMVPADAAARVAQVKQANAETDPDSDDTPPEEPDDKPGDADTPAPEPADVMDAQPAAVASTCGYGSPWDEHTQAVLEALQTAVAEVESIYVRALAQDHLERKEGRRISAATRMQLQQCLDVRPALDTAFSVIEQLLADTAPPPKGYMPRHKLLALRLGLASVSPAQ